MRLDDAPAEAHGSDAIGRGATRPRRTWLRRARRIVYGLVLAGVAWVWLVEPRWIATSERTVLAPVRTAVRIAHVTDLHTSGLGGVERSFLAALHDARPDVVVVTGDTVDGGDWEAARPVLSEIRAPLGVWIVDGNWEHWSRAEAPAAFFDSVGARHLRNESARVRDDLWVVGLDDGLAGRPDLERALADVPEGPAVVVLLHTPEPFDALAPRLARHAPRGSALAFAGHTHGGQVRLPFLGPLWLPPGSGRFVAGAYAEAGVPLFVSRGIGTSILPVRFLCRPELAITVLAPDR